MISKSQFFCQKKIYWPAHEIANAQKHPLNAHADISRGARSPNHGPSLHPHSCFVYASIEGSGESVHGSPRAFVA